MGLAGSIFITGGSGTLGHAILLAAKRGGWPCTFTIYARSESRQAAMRRRFPHARYVLGDVRDADRLAAAIAGHDLVIHAAAMKRIPECEAQPGECYATNVIGSLHVLRAARLAGVARVIGISTDKACRATTAYGASKLCMEKAFQAMPGDGPIATLVRYGNVVASTGSVIPTWRRQAGQGLALTITNPEMTRFWMAPSAAVDLIVRATSDPSGMIRVPKMSSLSIAELAAIVCPNAEQQVIGLRSAEKIHEDLVHDDEAAIETRTHYLIGPGGAIGYRYTSSEAPRLSAEAFAAMLDEAEELERL